VKFDKIQNTLGFRATVSLAEGIQEIVHAVRSDRAIDWRDPKYSNLKQMQSTVLKVLKFDLDEQESHLELQATRAFLRKAA
jgi:hypothetical protein